ncbi:MAG: Ig-like domain-containing protein [Microgenomates group bacterium]
MMKIMKRTLFFLVFSLFALLLFSLFFWLYEAKFFIGRASVTSLSFSVDNSYLFVTPLRAKANGKEKIRVTVFVLNNQGLGVMGKKVFIGRDPNLFIDDIQALTDSYGKAVFDVASQKKGEYYLEVKVEDKVLPQKAHLSFY